MDEDVVVVVITGIPASGKTTLATSLSTQLGWPLISKDVVKEALFDVLGTGDLEWSQRLGRAGHVVMYSLAATIPKVILEAHFQRGVAEPEILALNRRIVQIYCRCPVDVAAERYRGRIDDPARHAGHLPEHQSDQVIEQWMNAVPTPLDLPNAVLVEVDTTGPVDLGTAASAIHTFALRRCPLPHIAGWAPTSWGVGCQLA
ncbi:MAG TPA: AAA family ATPase [Acidimicrobiales bacterium]|nr:AAA family ATPase [Acidimicrobiales bacterium]